MATMKRVNSIEGSRKEKSILKSRGKKRGLRRAKKTEYEQIRWGRGIFGKGWCKMVKHRHTESNQSEDSMRFKLRKRDMQREMRGGVRMKRTNDREINSNANAEKEKERQTVSQINWQFQT